MTATATKQMSSAWNKKIADNTNPFDEDIEMKWIKQWLFYANTVRYASAMTGAYDDTGFNNGWWELTHNLRKMQDQIKLLENIKQFF